MDEVDAQEEAAAEKGFFSTEVAPSQGTCMGRYERGVFGVCGECSVHRGVITCAGPWCVYVCVRTCMCMYVQRVQIPGPNSPSPPIVGLYRSPKRWVFQYKTKIEISRK